MHILRPLLRLKESVNDLINLGHLRSIVPTDLLDMGYLDLHCGAKYDASDDMLDSPDNNADFEAARMAHCQQCQ